MTVLLAILAAGLLLRAMFLGRLIVKYRTRSGVLGASLHAGMIAAAGALATAAATRTATLYFVIACGFVLAADLAIREVLDRRGGPSPRGKTSP